MYRCVSSLCPLALKKGITNADTMIGTLTNALRQTLNDGDKNGAYTLESLQTLTKKYQQQMHDTAKATIKRRRV